MATRIPFEYWSDPLCIWAFVAQDKLDTLLAEHGHRLDVSYRIIPVFGSVPHRFAKGSWSEAGPEGRAASTRRVAHARGHAEVTGQVWVDDPPASSWASGMAAKAAFAMEAAGEAGEGAGAGYLLALRRAFFVDDRNIARRDVQLQLAEELELDRTAFVRRLDDGSALASLYEDHLERESLRLQGSPTFVFDGGRAQLYGNFDHAILDATVESLEKGLDVGGSNC